MTFFRSAATACALALVARPALAQIDPSDSGAGTKLGLAQRNNSGQVGTVTLFAHGANATLVVLRLASEPAGRREPAMVHRGRSCDAMNVRPAFALAPVIGGASRTIVELPPSRLLSGNYVVDVRASDTDPSRSVSCGELYR